MQSKDLIDAIEKDLPKEASKIIFHLDKKKGQAHLEVQLDYPLVLKIALNGNVSADAERVRAVVADTLTRLHSITST